MPQWARQTREEERGVLRLGVGSAEEGGLVAGRGLRQPVGVQREGWAREGGARMVQDNFREMGMGRRWGAGET